ncbi:putative extracellular repeat, HAF family [Pseudodesulfovibrio profundus]|uniref:Putative extracellular repeat, HAF family n=1 Tax=Pseudodesulfovibrio profundus TaxID=57320 RepID=A0A2C8FC24_9BACT|nr:autotransporter domain-containing protein [Pseudodesulfovibrio profundus]SOB59999.1 putative extracellular repeat, HAF family [Pseudodesulfovibrio profundus]
MSSGLQLSAPNSLYSLISFLIILQLAFIVTPGKALASSLSIEEIRDFSITGISQNGNIVVGSKNIDGKYRAAQWSNGKVTILTSEPNSVAAGVSANGAVAIGVIDYNTTYSRAVRWVNGKMSYLEGPEGFTMSSANSVSSNGSVVVGTYRNQAGFTQAFRWTQSQGMVGLGALDSSYPLSRGVAVSADGSTVVGGGNSNNGLQAFRWKNDTMIGLGFLHQDLTGKGESFAKDVSANGSVVIGFSKNERGQSEAFRWVNGTMSPLGFLEDGIKSTAQGVSDDGGLVVGYSSDSNHNSKAFRWTESQGMVSIEQLLKDGGVDLTGINIRYALGTNADGSIIHCSQGTGDGLLINIPYAGIITPEALYQSLDVMGQVSPMVSNMGQLSMNRLANAASGHASRSRVNPLAENSRGMSSGDTMPGRLDLWMVGSFGTNIELDSDDINLHGGLGLSWETDNWRFGGGLFADSRDLETGYNGSQDISALGPGAFVTYSPEGTRFEFRVSSLWQSVDLDLTRGYMNGAGYATSSGSTEAEVFSLSGQVQWTGNISETLSLTPFIEYTWQTTRVDAYTESGGPFPAKFDSREEYSNLIRTGLRADVALIDKLDTWVWGAWNHRLEDSSTGMSGSATGIGAFAYPGAPIDQDWADVGVGAAWSITDRLSASTSLGFAVGCDDNSVSDTTLSAGLSYQLW